MTSVAVFESPSATHIIADSLVSESNPDVNRTDQPEVTLSTGLRLDGFDQHEVRFSEGYLKIARVAENVALGFAGRISLGNDLFRLVRNGAASDRFPTFDHLKRFIQDSALPSLLPAEGELEVIGLHLEGEKATRFKMQKSGSFCCLDRVSCGSGARILDDELDRTTWPSGGLVSPQMEFGVLSGELIVHEVLGRSANVTKSFTGGAITGIYSSGGRVSWQASQVYLVFVNRGGIGDSAKFERLPFIYKVWPDKENGSPRV